jgi:hypothetical protein
MSQTHRAFVIPSPPDSWGVRDVLFVFGGSRFVVAQACLPQAGFSLCAFVFVGAGLTPVRRLVLSVLRKGATRRVFVFL